MTVLMNLKDWLTLDEASTYLSAEFSESISVSDIIRLALDNRLQLSLRYVDDLPIKQVRDSFVKEVLDDVRESMKKHGGLTVFKQDSFVWSALSVFKAPEHDKLHSIQRFLPGVSNVVTRSVEAILNNLLAETIGGGASSQIISGGILLRAKAGHYIQIRQCADFHKTPRSKELTEPPLKSFPAEKLPECASFVVMSKDLAAFVGATRPDTKESRPLSTTERNTLLTVIAALCDYSAVHHQERGAATQIAKMTEEIGAPVTDDTIRKLLAKIPDALESRKK